VGTTVTFSGDALVVTGPLAATLTTGPALAAMALVVAALVLGCAAFALAARSKYVSLLERKALSVWISPQLEAQISPEDGSMAQQTIGSECEAASRSRPLQQASASPKKACCVPRVAYGKVAGSVDDLDHL